MKRLAPFLVIFLLVALLPLSAMAASAGKITRLRGLVEIISVNNEIRKAVVGEEVWEGEVVRTKSRSRAEIKFIDGSVMRLARNSRVKVTQYQVVKKRTRGIFNLFEGRVQNIVKKASGYFGRQKENRYEVHTPTAVCGVRGTDFFVSHINGVTQSAVKSGVVYAFSNNQPGEEREVRAGQSMVVVTADKPPVIRPATDKDLILEDDDDDESSPPGGEDSGEVLGGEDGDLVSDGDTIDDPPAFGEPMTLFEAIIDNDYLVGTLEGQIGDFSNQGTFAVEGSFTDGPPTAGSTGAGDLAGETSGGGAFGGYLGGVVGSWEGLFAGIWVNSVREAGYVYSFLSGSVSGASLTAEGDAFRSDKLGTIDDPAALADMATEITGIPLPEITSLPVGGGGTVSGDVMTGFSTNGGRRYLSVWSLQTSDGTVDPAFQGTTSTILYGDHDGSYYSLGYLTIADNGAGHVEISPYADTPITYIDDEFIGSFSTWYRGVHDGYGGSYTSIGAGTATLDRMSYSGSWGGESLHADVNGDFVDVGSEYGLFGGLASPWNSGSLDFFAMGEFNVDPAYGGTPLLWNTEISGDGLDNSGSPEGGLIEGFTAGHWKAGASNGAMQGYATAIYLAPDGRAGLLKGNLSGNWFAGVDMFSISGSLGRTYKETLASPGSYYVTSDNLSANIFGDFNGEGLIEGYNWGGDEFAYLTDGTSYLPWGTYNLRLGFSNEYYRSADTFTAWSAMIGGSISGNHDGYYLGNTSGSWNAAGEINGQLSSTWQTISHRGTMTGPFYGHNSFTTGSWIGESIGTFSGQELAWGGAINSTAPNSGVLYIHTGAGGLGDDALLEATIGSLSAPWLASTSDFYALGSTSVPVSGDHLLTTAFQGSDQWPLPAADEQRVLMGLAGGMWNADGSISNVTAVSLYTSQDGHISATGQAGLLLGAATGAWYDDLEMFELNGNWSSLAIASGAPGEITIVDNGSFAGDRFYGGFAPGYTLSAVNGASESYTLETATETYALGIFSQQLGLGNYARPTGADTSTWNAVIGGADAFGSRVTDNGYWLAQVNGTWNTNGQIIGTLDQGTYLTETHSGWVFGGLTGLSDAGYAGMWAGQVVGGWQGGQLDFGSDIDFGELAFNAGGYPNAAGDLTGNFGLSMRNATSYDALTIGEFDEAMFVGRPYLWTSYVDGDEVYADDGRFAGYSSGQWQNTSDPGDTSGAINLYTALVAYRDDGTVSLITGGMSGTSYDMDSSSDGLFMAAGILSAQNFATPTEFDPTNAWIGNREMYGGLSGRFTTGFDPAPFDTVSGSIDGETTFITYSYGGGSASLPFGVYQATFLDGNFDFLPLSAPAAPDQVGWTADVGGYGGFGYRFEDMGFWQGGIASTWDNSDGTIDGTLTGSYLTMTHLGTISGSFDGLFDVSSGFYGGGGYYGFGDWTGLSVGAYQAAEQLEFGAMLGDGSGGSLLYGGGSYLMGMGYPKETQGIFGFNEVNAGTLALTGMGTFMNPMGMLYGGGMYGGGMYGGMYGGYAANIWHASFEGPEVTGSNADTSGYGGVFGYSSGLWLHGYSGGYGGDYTGNGDIKITIAGLAWSEEDQTASLLTGKPTGTFAGDQFGYSGYWQMSGTINNRVMPTPADFAVDGNTEVENRGIGNMSFLAGRFAVDDWDTIFAETIPSGSKASFITYLDGGGDRQSLPWGIFNLKFGMGYGGMMGYGGTSYIPFNNPYPEPGDTMGPWTATIGGYGGFGYHSEGYGDGKSDRGFWIADVTGPGFKRSDNPSMFAGTVEATLNGAYLTYTHRGTMTGDVYGLFQQPPFWVGTSVGTYESTQALDFSGDWGYGGSGNVYLYDHTFIGGLGYGGAFDIEGGHVGLLGGIENGNGSLTVWAMGLFGSEGSYGGGSPDRYISAWTEGTDVNTVTPGGFALATVATMDGYGGMLTGASVALRYDADGNPVLYTGRNLTGSVYSMAPGTVYPGYGGYWDLTGTLLPGTTGFTGSVTNLTSSGSYGGGAGGDIFLDELVYEDAPEITGEPFSLSVFAMTGTADGYGAAPTTLWELQTEFDAGGSHNFIQVKGDNWDKIGPPSPGVPNNAFGGDLSGAWVSFNNGDTGIIGGDVRGLFDPATGTSWMAGGMIMNVSTQEFMDAIKNDRVDALMAMNVPTWAVGMDTLVGNDGNLNVSMNNVTFFAMDQVSTPPTIWATDSVTGSFSTVPNNTASVGLSGVSSSLAANFEVNNWAAGAGGVWGATVENGTGDVGGWVNVNFHGGAAGTNTTATDFTGTAAGIVTQASPAMVGP